MSSENFKSIVMRQCMERNKNIADIGCEYRVFSKADAKEICDFYHSYDGRQEFLYVPSLEEISGVLEKDNSVYVGVVSKNSNNILGITKVAEIEESPYPFFKAPKNAKKNENGFYGVSGLFIRKEAQGKKLATHLVDLSFASLQEYKAAGIYADCDFRNIASFNTLSKKMDFVGYTDGRMGASGEKTIYVTFFSNLEAKEREENRIELDFSSTYQEAFSLYDWYKPVEASISSQLRQLGNVSTFMVPYGNEGTEEFKVGCDFNCNFISVLDTPISTKGIKLNLGRWFPAELLRARVENVTYNSGDDTSAGGGVACAIEKKAKGKSEISTRAAPVSKKKVHPVAKSKVGSQQPSAVDLSKVSVLLSSKKHPSRGLIRALSLSKKKGLGGPKVIGDYSWAPVSNIDDYLGISVHGAIWAPVSNIVVVADKELQSQGLLGLCVGRLHGTSRARQAKTNLMRAQLLKIKGGTR